LHPARKLALEKAIDTPRAPRILVSVNFIVVSDVVKDAAGAVCSEALSGVSF